MRITFGDCSFDRDTRELIRGGSTVHAGRKMLALLELLVDARPRALTKDDIHQALWPGTFVSEATLSSLVAELRSAIGDDARAPRFVRTVHGFGYAFHGEVAAVRFNVAAHTPVYRLIYGDREIGLAEGEIILGRSNEATVFVDGTGVSRRHARITIRADGVTVEDLGSKNGTLVDGRAITRPTRVTDGTRLVLGATSLTLRTYDSLSSTSTRTVEQVRPTRGEKA